MLAVEYVKQDARISAYIVHAVYALLYHRNVVVGVHRAAPHEVLRAKRSEIAARVFRCVLAVVRALRIGFRLPACAVLLELWRGIVVFRIIGRACGVFWRVGWSVLLLLRLCNLLLLLFATLHCT